MIIYQIKRNLSSTEVLEIKIESHTKSFYKVPGSETNHAFKTLWTQSFFTKEQACEALVDLYERKLYEESQKLEHWERQLLTVKSKLYHERAKLHSEND